MHVPFYAQSTDFIVFGFSLYAYFKADSDSVYEIFMQTFAALVECSTFPMSLYFSKGTKIKKKLFG